MSLRVLSWHRNNTTGDVFPKFQDDRAFIDPLIVKEVLDWLQSRFAEFKQQAAPTNQLLNGDGGATRFIVGNDTKKLQPTIAPNGLYEWEMGTVEIHMPGPNGMILASTEWLHARCIRTGSVIIGPRLRYQQLAPIS